MPPTAVDRVDVIHGGTPSTIIREEPRMAALDSDSALHWKEHLYKSAQRQSDSADFFSNSLSSQHLEGKVGMRESVAVRNLPPNRDPATAGGA